MTGYVKPLQGPPTPPPRTPNRVIYHQKGYEGREYNAIAQFVSKPFQKSIPAIGGYTTKEIQYELRTINCVSQIKEEPEFIIGSVEFIEQYIGSRKPDYYPKWTESIWRRNIYNTHLILDELSIEHNFFIKDSKKYKSVEAFVFKGNGHSLNETLKAKNILRPIYSDIVNFVEEWRYYVANGKVLTSWWYKGNEKTSESNPNGPHLKLDIPEDFCGAVDVGLLDTGELAIVEVQHPYAIGWYGDNTEEEINKYVQFLTDGFESL